MRTQSKNRASPKQKMPSNRTLDDFESKMERLELTKKETKPKPRDAKPRPKAKSYKPGSPPRRKDSSDDDRSSEEEVVLYHGDRGEAFVEMLTSVFRKGRVMPDTIATILDEEGLKTFDEAFTAKSYNTERNYEMLEQLGDVLANASIKWYMTRRFPEIRCPEGVETGSRLLINYGSKYTFHPIAEKLGFWPFISASAEQRQRNKKPLLEDVLEAFLGAVAEVVDKRTTNSVGYSIVYNILEAVYDDMEILLTEENLVDPKSRLKETFDANQNEGEVVYLSERKELPQDDNSERPMYITIATAYQLKRQHEGLKLAHDKTEKDLERMRRIHERAISSMNEMLDDGTNEEGEDLTDEDMSEMRVLRDKHIAELDRLVQAHAKALAAYKAKLIWLGEGRAALKKDAEKKAAAQGLVTAEKKGITKKAKEFFSNAANQKKVNRRKR